MMPLLWVASFLTLVVLAIAFAVALGVRLFTKRRPPLVTRRAAVCGAIAVGVFALGWAGFAADGRVYESLRVSLGELGGAGMDEVEQRLGSPQQRYQPPFVPIQFCFPLGDKAEKSAEIWAYDAGVWYSPYQPCTRFLACFDSFGRLFHVTVDD